MIKINFKEPKTKEWKKWRNKCLDKQHNLNISYHNGAPSKIDELLYKERSDHYLGIDSPFHGKCAYCESLIAPSQPGDIDHFRPKLKVTQFGSEVSSKGYYWLTYDSKNLLPACQDCNRPSKKKTKGQIIGKRNEFPIKEESLRAFKPGDEIHEKPLLLNPTDEGFNPYNHFKLHDNGILEEITEEGKTCIDIFGLNIREALPLLRRDAFIQGKSAYRNSVFAFVLGGQLNNDNQEIVNSFTNGVKPYSFAGRLGIAKAFQEIQEVLRQTSMGISTDMLPP